MDREIQEKEAVLMEWDKLKDHPIVVILGIVAAIVTISAVFRSR